MTIVTASTEFRAVDLVVRSRRSLAPLFAAWPWAQTPGRQATRAPRWLVVIPRGNPQSADKAMWEFVRMVHRLSPAAKRCWNEASSRTFDIGIQAGLAPASFEDVRLRYQTIEAIGRVRGSILVTVYAPYPEEESGRIASAAQR